MFLDMILIPRYLLILTMAVCIVSGFGLRCLLGPLRDPGETSQQDSDLPSDDIRCQD